MTETVTNVRVEVVLGLNDVAIPLNAVSCCCCGSRQCEGSNDEPLSLCQVDICGVDLVGWGVEGVPAHTSNMSVLPKG